METQLVRDPNRRRAEADRFGLQWPPPGVKRGRGPPTFKINFVEAVYVALRAQGLGSVESARQCRDAAWLEARVASQALLKNVLAAAFGVGRRLHLSNRG